MAIHLREILNVQKPKVGNTLFIAVDGHGGSGKSTLAKLLAEKLEASLIQTDDFANWDHPLDWWPFVVERVFEPIQGGANTLSYPCTKWHESHRPEPAVEQPVTRIMILEGVSSSRKEFRDYISLSIFVDTPKEICFKRGIERDGGTGKSREELERIWNDWFEEEEEYFQRDDPKGYADIVIDGTKSFEDQITLS